MMTTGNKLYKLFKIQCYDLLCLLEMERNGILFNTEEAMKHATEIESKQLTLLNEFHNILGTDVVSITSNDHLSVILYGGTIITEYRVAVGVFKTGNKIGMPRYRVEEIEHNFPRRVEPIEGTETQKSIKNQEKYIEALSKLPDEPPPLPRHYWEVNEPVLRKLKVKGDTKRLLTIVLEYSKLEKLRGTYLVGYTEMIEEMHWPHNRIHGNLNQCIAVTGRLTSNKPNLQNADKQTKKFMETRYDS